MRVRLLPLSVVLCAGVAVVPGCDLLLEGFCDPEVDETCVDPTKAQIIGTITIPEANNASSTKKTLSPQESALRAAFTKAVRARKDLRPHDISQRTRVPVVSHGNDFEVQKYRVEKFRPGEVIVRAHEPIRGRKAEISRALSIWLHDDVVVNVRLCGTEFRCLADLTHPDGKPLDLADTADIVTKLDQMPFLKFAERNLILEKAAVTPDDEFFAFQWHYTAISVPDAWEITKGDPGIVGAVIDTGILFAHPDLADRIVGGADLIDDADVANDGDGRDDDGDDAGDNSCGSGCHSHHGSHVGGTMGASTDNGTMVSGITWEGGLLAVRTLGDGGGSLNDIADGIEWSIGNDVDGVRSNPTPADVLNMSLGGQGESQALNESVSNAVDAGAIVLVAAGNDDQDAEAFTPANAPDSITVASVGNGAGGTPVKASYSNFGPLVDIAGPGGEQAVDNDDDGNGDGVLSTIGDFVAFYQGTSMATPHVAGVAMLMKSVNPDLTQDEVRTILQETADTDIDCDVGCGAGQLNAFGAVTAAQNGGVADGIAASGVRVGRGSTKGIMVFRNFGDSAVNATFEVGGSDRDAVSINPASASIPAKGKVSVEATIARNETADDVGSVTITAIAGADSAEGRLEWSSDQGIVIETVLVGAAQLLDNGEIEVDETKIVETTSLQNFNYQLFNMPPGEYRVIGVLDVDNDLSFGNIGFFVAPAEDDSVCSSAGTCGHVIVEAGETYTGANFLVAPGFNGGDDVGGGGDAGLGDACAAPSDCGDGLYCESFSGGYCTSDCNDSASECPDGSTCFDIGVDNEPYQICFRDCAVDADCGRAGYVCDVVADIGSCIPE
ncbi:MAG: S8 family serine peptidase [Deltaproteobacteria bacterium]|nr:S8 family serine peptidase [Deltaproteobacteria bacterium]